MGATTGSTSENGNIFCSLRNRGKSFIASRRTPGTVLYMAVILHVRPGEEQPSFEDFVLNTPESSVALDGYVRGAPQIGKTHADFDHHEGVERYQTPSTCLQVLAAIDSGNDFLESSELNVYVNDHDPDVAFSVWLLHNRAYIPLLKPEQRNRLEQVFLAEDRVDVSGGVYAGDTEPEVLETLAWICDLWCQQRASGAEASEEDMRAAIASMCGRLSSWVLAGISAVGEVSMEVETIAQLGTVAVIREHHPLARTTLASKGVEVFISVLNPLGTKVTVGTTTPEGDNLNDLWPLLNSAEKKVGGVAAGQWGGSDSVGGSPRLSGTSLNLATILSVVHHWRTRK